MEESPSSPTSRLKFLCSYGGRILPRPSDGLLRYVGGETRVLAVHRSITFAELKEKTAGMFNADVVVKYQLIADDLDALVTVKTDDDLYHMLDEYDRRPRSPTVASSPRFRLFLFPASAASPQAAEAVAPLEQRYVEAINGGLPIPAPHHTSRPHFSTASSAATSPTSTTDSSAAPLHVRANAGRGAIGGGIGGGGMHRVRSTPNLGDGRSGSQPGSPRAYLRPSTGFGYGGGAGWRMGSGVRQELNVGGCMCGNGSSSSQVNRRYYVCSSPTTGGSPLGSLAEGSPPRRGGQGFHVGPPPPFAAPLRRPIWE
ncbi:hypothetical protein HPP92_001838 [Vanilla planifolia]|uniref:PB1 domain-containing protein n=1 Tax=Vanilla planifolia TaxID=51239 RepID=A0A835S8I0_VANPL|nr:hypothetical protein HPP92_002038 [Vanilla planifolia]KAG0501766.1 hypothetical protein HPP92_001838 [Vanilla planifolia]